MLLTPTSVGGTPEQQCDFLNILQPSLSPKSSRRNYHRHNREELKSSTLSNRYALGYNYHDVLDTDEQDVLARLSVHMLSNPSGAFAPLLNSLFTVKTVSNSVIVILLDWGNVFGWPAELRQWIRVLRQVAAGLGEDVKRTMAEVMEGWKARNPPSSGDGHISTAGPVAGAQGSPTVETMSSALPSSVPLGPGEWEDEIGVPVCVVCTNAEKQEKLEKDLGWQEGDFDFVLQWMRCVLLKREYLPWAIPEFSFSNIWAPYQLSSSQGLKWQFSPTFLDGASLSYTTSFDSNDFQTLIHSSLGIESFPKPSNIKYNIIDRDKILIPPNWDSWAKIRILKEGFEMEAVANAWSVEIQAPPEPIFDRNNAKNKSQASVASKEESDQTSRTPDGSAISIFLSTLPDPSATQPFLPSTATEDVVTVTDTQTFLAEQARRLEKMRLEDEQQTDKRGRKPEQQPIATNSSARHHIDLSTSDTRDQNTEQSTGRQQVSVNIGGIQVDAEEMTRQIKQREIDREHEAEKSRQRQREREQDRELAGSSSVREKEKERRDRLKELNTSTVGGAGGSTNDGNVTLPSTPRRDSPVAGLSGSIGKQPAPAGSGASTTPDGNKGNQEALASYFANLMKNAEKKESPRRGVVSHSAAGSEK